MRRHSITIIGLHQLDGPLTWPDAAAGFLPCSISSQVHDLRHSYATAALKAGVHLKTVSARLGHASETFTASVDQHALPGMDREAASAIAALFLGKATDQAVSGSV
jgi:hypothetical protein